MYVYSGYVFGNYTCKVLYRLTVDVCVRALVVLWDRDSGSGGGRGGGNINIHKRHSHARGARISLRLRSPRRQPFEHTQHAASSTTHPTCPTMTLHFRVVCALLHSATLVCAIPYTQPISGAPKVKLKVSATASVPVQCSEPVPVQCSVQCSEPTVVVCVHVCVHVHVCTMLAARPARLPLSLAGPHHAQGARACDRQRLRGDRLCD
jgi:hypothetical protein